MSKKRQQKLVVAVVAIDGLGDESRVTLDIFDVPPGQLTCDPAKGISPAAPVRGNPRGTTFVRSP